MKLKGNLKEEIVEIKGEVIDSFSRVEDITEVILLGDKGGVRRITIDNE